MSKLSKWNLGISLVLLFGYLLAILKYFGVYTWLTMLLILGFLILLGVFLMMISFKGKDESVKWSVIAYTTLWVFVEVVFNYNCKLCYSWWGDFFLFSGMFFVGHAFLGYCSKLDLTTYKKGGGKEGSVKGKKLKKIKGKGLLKKSN